MQSEGETAGHYHGRLISRSSPAAGSLGRPKVSRDERGSADVAQTNVETTEGMTQVSVKQ